MTTTAQNRCANCKTLYWWHPSTYGWSAGPENDGTYCPECKKAIVEALAKIPEKERQVQVEITDATEKAKIMEQNWKYDTMMKGQLRRVYIGEYLINTKKPLFFLMILYNYIKYFYG